MNTTSNPGREATAHGYSAVGAPGGWNRWDPGAILTALVPALTIVYLGLENGGYDLILRSEVGIVLWWAVLLAVGIGLLPVPAGTRTSLVAIGLFVGFTLWTAIALEWTESAERTVTELTRVVTYLGALLLGISLVMRGQAAARPLLAGVTLGLAILAALGTLSRLKLGWFPENEIGAYLPGIEIERRLAYPLNYSSAVGIMAGMTLPLLWAAAWWPRNIIAKALAAAALPLAGLALYLATSGSGAAAAAVGLAVLLVLVPDRIPKLLTLGAGAAGTAILAQAVDSREALDRGLITPAAEQQGNDVMLLAMAVCAGLAGIQVALDLAGRVRPSWLQISRRQAQIATVIACVIAVPVASGIGAPGEVSDRWETFKGRGDPDAPASTSATILDFSSNGRYEFWKSAVDANEMASITGIGPGTFEFWWARNGSYHGFIRDAHSLYLENLAELGIVGLILIVAFVLLIIGAGAVRSFTSTTERRLVLAAATAAGAAFAFGAALDWVWELAALPVAFMFLAAIAVTGFSRPNHGVRRRSSKYGRHSWIQRGAVATLAIAAIALTWHSLKGAETLEQSRAEYAAGNIQQALVEAEVAVDARPYAASPRIQRALILERQGRLRPAASSARAATSKERTNWRNWLVLARLEARAGNSRAALAAYKNARRLNAQNTGL